MQGIVVFLNSNIGTKSEAIQPWLYTGMGTIIRLYKSGDNPFENESLIPYDSKEVCITGEIGDNQILMIESITLYDNQYLQSEDTERDQPFGCAEISENVSLKNEREVFTNEKMY